MNYTQNRQITHETHRGKPRDEFEETEAATRKREGIQRKRDRMREEKEGNTTNTTVCVGRIRGMKQRDQWMRSLFSHHQQDHEVGMKREEQEDEDKRPEN